MHKKDGERSDNEAENEDDDIICKKVEAVCFHEKGFSSALDTILEQKKKSQFLSFFSSFISFF